MKKLIALLLALVMVLGLAACGGNPAPTDPVGSDPVGSDPAKENVTIEVFIAQVDWADAWDVMEAKFEEEHPWIDVQHVGLGSDSNFLQTRMSTNDLPDVIQINKGDVYSALVSQNLLTDLTNYECAAVMPEGYAAAYSEDGKLLAMCQGAAYSCMFYNMAILNEAGWDAPPANWDELLQCCADIAEKTDAAPIVTAAGKHTTAWMTFELVLANTICDEIGAAAYQDSFKDGTFKFGDYPEIATKYAQIAPYFMEGSASAMEEDAITAMADGAAAMCLAGNWNGAQIAAAIGELNGDESTAAASLPPFGAAGATPWISTSPEDGFAVVANERTAAEQEAVDTFFNWVFEAENFKIIQNARGTSPVITNMTAEHIVLADCLIPVAAQMGSAPSVLMGFNLYAAEFKDAAIGKIGDVLSGNASVDDLIATMDDMLPKSYMNQ